MREIVFRGKDKYSNKWRYGYLSIDNQRDRMPYYKIVTDDGTLVQIYNIKQDTVCQFTGICDKNYVEVFEGDIIRVIVEGEEDTYMVEWCGYRNYPAFDLKPQIDCDSNGLSYLLNVGAEIEVIGNKFDNPELLEA